MNPGYCIPEGSPDRQRQGTSKQRGVLRMVKFPFESNFKQITYHYQSKQFLKKCQQIVRDITSMHHHQSQACADA